jgi:hypothetical protein
LSGIVVQQGFNAASGSGLAAATQAEQETGTSVLVATTPGRQHFHQSAAKCWGKFTQNSTTVEVGYNITSVADTNTGIMTVTIGTDFSGVDYAIVATAVTLTDQFAKIDSATPPVAGSFIMECYDADSTITDPSDSWMVVCFGDQ